MKIKSFPLYLLYTWLIIFGLVPILMMLSASFLSKDSAHLVTVPFTLEHYLSLYSLVFAKIFFSIFSYCFDYDLALFAFSLSI